MRIIWLHGPPAVGKSVTAWALLNALSDRDPATGYLDIDQIGMSPGDEVEDPERHLLKGRALAAVAAEFAGQRIETLVVSGVVGPELMDFYASELRGFDVALIRLTVGVDELRRRLESRGQYAEDWTGVEEYALALDAMHLEHPVVATDGGRPEDVARRVLQAIEALPLRRTPAPPAAAVPVEAARVDDPLRAPTALLIGGTTAVGKSTIGWEAFMATRDRGDRSAFIDLRQLGFVGREGGAVDHDLQARACGALWRVFRVAGADLLILNGPVNSSADLHGYRAALTGTQLTAVRLTADRGALVARVEARSRGQIAPLAGDALRGLPHDQVEAVVDVALGTQDSTPEEPGFPTLDTTGVEAEASARLLLEHGWPARHS